MIILEKLYYAIALGLVLAVAVSFGLHGDEGMRNGLLYVTGLALWLHVMSGVLWVGLLWYFNLVQIPTMPKIPAELKPAIGKFIAPEALFWFRHAALATMATGLLVAWLKGYIVDALSLHAPAITIGIGMWLGLVMAFNVWAIIWPNQKRALGLVIVDDTARAKAARIATLTSRTNFVLSLPMLYCMITQNAIG